MTRKKSVGTELSVFKGREAKLNLAIFITLAQLGPLTITELQKQVSKQKRLRGTYYASLTKRIGCLVKDDYIKEVQIQTNTKAAVYQLTNKALLALFLHPNSMQEILDKSSEAKRAFLLLALINSVQI
jgi:DNA-binding MarR family transcriptional regulator